MISLAFRLFGGQFRVAGIARIRSGQFSRPELKGDARSWPDKVGICLFMFSCMYFSVLKWGTIEDP